MLDLLIAEEETALLLTQPVQLALFPDLVPVEPPLVPISEQEMSTASPASPYQLLLFPPEEMIG